MALPVGKVGELSPIFSRLMDKNDTNSSQKPFMVPVTNLDYSTESTIYNISNQTHVEFFDLAQTVVFGTWLSISMVLAIFGNLMVIMVVWRHRGMRTRTNMFLVNLAIADFLVGLIMAPFSITTLIYEEWIFGKMWCFVNSFCNALFFMTSIHTLMYISIHKYLSIVRPLTRITKCKIMIMITAAWTWAAICGALTTFILSHAVYKPGTMQCGPEYPAYTPKALIFHIIIQVSNIFIPLGIMLFAYFRMFREIKEHMQRLDENSAMDRAQIYQQQRTVTITLFIVLACFFLCWIPYCVYANYVTFEPDKSKIKGYANAIAYCFGYMNSACNPIIYAWRSPSFREGYKEILCQEPSYVVSDDTIHDSTGTGPLGRFSVFLNSVKIQPNQSSRRGSAESQISARISRTSTTSNVSSHKLLRKVTSKTAKGSSIIRRDDSIILVKNGKVVSVREDAAFKRTSSPDDVFLPSPVSKFKSLPSSNSSANSSLNVLPECEGEISSHVNQNGHINVAETDKGDNSDTPLLGTDLEQSYEEDYLDRSRLKNFPKKETVLNAENFRERTEADNMEAETLMSSEESSALLGQKFPRTRSETNLTSNVFNFEFPNNHIHAKSLDDIYALPLVRTPSNEHLDTYIHSSNHHKSSGDKTAVNS